MQPAQLSLLDDQIRTPAPIVLGALREEDVAETVQLLGDLIAKASRIAMAAATQEVGDE